MNSRLIIYLGHQVRTLLIISQVISDAKLYLKYPSESAQLITTAVPENINDYIIKASQPSSPRRQINTTTNLPTTNLEDDDQEIFTTPMNKTLSPDETIYHTQIPPSTSSKTSKTNIEPVSSSNQLDSQSWTWFRSSIKTSFIQNKEHSSSSTLPHTLSSNITQMDQNKSHDSHISLSKDKTPEPTSIIVDKHLEKLKKSRLHIGPGTILLTFILSKFDYLTYLTLIVNFLASGAALIWLPLLISIYFWAILTFPYPSRHFWHVITLSSMIILLAQ